MALQGSLSDFGFIEVMQLIASQEKTGILRVNGVSSREELVFEGGQVISAWDPRTSSRDPFRDFLLRREIVPRESLARVQKAEIRSPHSFAEILLRMRVLGHGELQDAFAEHIQEKIDELVAWKRGTFEFVPQENVVRYTTGIGLKPEGLLMEAVRRADESAGTLIRPETILVRTEGSSRGAPTDIAAAGPPSDTDTGAQRNEQSGEPLLSPAAAAILPLIDGKRSFAILTRDSGLDRVEAIVAAEELLENNCVAIYTKAAAVAAATSAAPSTTGVLLHTTALACILLLSVVGHRWFAAEPNWKGENPVRDVALRIDQIEEERSLVAIRVALDFAHHRSGSYPEKLDSLVGDGLVTSDDLRFLRDRRLVYYTIEEGQGYRLEPGESASVVRRPKL
ncbi:MAG: DUF4388 domain-containing protein [bacterium]